MLSVFAVAMEMFLKFIYIVRLVIVQDFTKIMKRHKGYHDFFRFIGIISKLFPTFIGFTDADINALAYMLSGCPQNI